jgi:Resolvase, N terminal domain
LLGSSCTNNQSLPQLNILDAVAKAGAGFKSLADAWADTTSPLGRLMLTFLGGLAEFERELIRARTGEGRKRAQARGVRFGRPPKPRLSNASTRARPRPMWPAPTGSMPPPSAACLHRRSCERRPVEGLIALCRRHLAL